MFNVILRLIATGAYFLGVAMITRLIVGADFAIVVVIASALFMVGFHAISAYRLKNWMNDLRLDNAPELSGWWDELGSRIYRNLKTYHRQQQLLSNSLLAFRNAAQALPDGVITINKENQINWCNETAEAQLGLRSPRDNGQVITNLIRDPDFVAFIKAKSTEKSALIKSPKNSRQILALQRVNYGEDQMLILTRDVTDREKLEHMRRDFVANVSHELKTPLTVLLGFLETVQEIDLPPEQEKKYLTLMLEQGGRMRTLIDDLLTLSSLEANISTGNDETIFCDKLMDRLKTDALALSDGHHKIQFEVTPNLNLRGREAEITSAFSNLISNAVRYTPEGGAISVKWFTAENGDLHFDVKDSGIGILPLHIPRLTERFYRVDRSRSRETGGTGLGLAIVKHVLTRHNGQLEIKSEFGYGSTFSAVLPASRRAPASN
jgi:two-component system phosphate regulon sensor histidine kinase PhoR